MNAITDKKWAQLSPSERKNIEDQIRRQYEHDINVILDIYMKMSCKVLHDSFGFGENRLYRYLGNWKSVFRTARKQVAAGTQISSLDAEMRQIFRKSGYPDAFFRGMFGDAWTADTTSAKTAPEVSPEASQFVRELKKYGVDLTPQQIRTIRGQALCGDIDGAKKGLDKILRQKEKEK